MTGLSISIPELVETSLEVVAFVGIALFLWSVARSFALVARSMAQQAGIRID